MRCKDNNNNNPGGTSRIGCGAYDYSCQTYIHDSTRVDSVLNFTPDHIISNFSGNTYNYSNTPVYNYYHYLFHYAQYNTVIDSIIEEDTIVVGIGNIDSNIVVNSGELAGKSQFLYLADQLNEKQIEEIIDKSELNPIDLIRKQEKVWKELFKNKLLSKNQIIQAIFEHPKLMQRPIFISENKAIIANPPEESLKIL